MVHKQYLTMRKLNLFFLFISLPLLSNAQLFSKAPDGLRPVSQIIEWTTFLPDGSDPEETIRDGVYTFRRDGQLQTWETNNSDDEIYHYQYDGKDRVVKVAIENIERTRLMKYQYFEDRQMAEIQEKEFDVRNIQYFNKNNKVVEEKTFVKGEITGGQWMTMKRVLLNYDEEGNVFGETIYDYDGSEKPTKYKVVHKHDAQNNKILTTQLNEKGKMYKETAYTFDENNRLILKTTKNDRSKITEKKTHLYKDEKIWQTITESDDYKFEKIYKDGQLVRLKEYGSDGKLIWYTDYQYLFF